VELPAQLLDSLTGLTGFDKEAFEKVHALRNQITSIRVNPLKVPDHTKLPSPAFQGMKQKGELEEIDIPWSQYGFYLSQRPSFTFDPVFHAGAYYVQEASSMFLEEALKQTADLSHPLKVLDLSAAPGGKSTHIQSMISSAGLLVSNEVIRSRASTLRDNIIKWGADNVIVTNNDPKDFARLRNYFDVIVADAPCSGSGLFRREPEAIGEWSPDNVALCSQRQQRILADIWPALKKDGILIYSTCSYSKEEDEEIMDWMIKELQVENLKLKVETDWGIVETISEMGGYGYRFWPDKVKGEGFFIACFRKKEGGDSETMRVKSKPEPASKKELPIIEKWINAEGYQFIKHENTVYAWPERLVSDLTILLSTLRVIYSGIRVGELIRDKLVPDHSLAMSRRVPAWVNTVAFNYEQAIQYLQRKDIVVQNTERGWALVNYEGYPLGWVNILPNRINNYYPKELRILKDSI
jgi:16S rRNA C967 or C1407 C5-methylase (RsmB/RsmF family)/NOL1/NOP2/fmu family ribosome biogenesis protein